MTPRPRVWLKATAGHRIGGEVVWPIKCECVVVGFILQGGLRLRLSHASQIVVERGQVGRIPTVLDVKAL